MLRLATLSLGTGLNTAEAFRRALKARKVHVDKITDRILGNLPNATTQKTEVHYIDVSVAELGFPICAVLEEIYAAGLKLKYKLCPAEVGLESCLQQMPVPDKRVYIAMKDILDPEFPKLGGTSRIFMVNFNAGKYALASQNGDPRIVHGSEDRFRFLCKR